MKHRFYYPAAILIFYLLKICGHAEPLLAMQGESLKDLVNKGYSRDRYHPRFTPGLFVPALQFGSGPAYDYEAHDFLRLDYFHSQRSQYSLVIANFEGSQTALGGEYLLQNQGRHRLWLGLQLRPQNLQLGPKLRGVYFLNRLTKFHYLGEIFVGDARMLAIMQAGMHSYPFASSKHTFIDLKAKFIQEHTEVSQERLQRKIHAYSLSAEIGHGWARFADVKGLELYGAIGLGHSRLQHSTSDCIGRSCELQDSETEIRLLVGVLFQYLSR